MAEIDFDALAEAHAAQLKKLEEAQAQYLTSFNEVWTSLLQQQQLLAMQLQREQTRLLAEAGAACQPGPSA
jgi:hypothetical protein